MAGEAHWRDQSPSGFSLQISLLQVNSQLMTEMHYHEKQSEIAV